MRVGRVALKRHMVGVWVLVGAVLVAVITGLLLRARSGKVRAAKSADLPDEVTALLDGNTPVTLVQISTQFCAPCRHARVMLSHVTDSIEGVRHVELDVTEQPEVAQRLHVMSTPTTLAIDHAGSELFRFSGLPKTDTLSERLRAHVG